MFEIKSVTSSFVREVQNGEVWKAWRVLIGTDWDLQDVEVCSKQATVKIADVDFMSLIQFYPGVAGYRYLDFSILHKWHKFQAYCTKSYLDICHNLRLPLIFLVIPM